MRSRKGRPKNMQETWGETLIRKLPKIAGKVGGETDILIGIKYVKYFPKDIIKLVTGVTVYESVFQSYDGSNGILGGPHSLFTKAEKRHNGIHTMKHVYFIPPVDQHRNHFKLECDMPLLGQKTRYAQWFENVPLCAGRLAQESGDGYMDGVGLTDNQKGDGRPMDAYAAKKSPKCIKSFDEVENTGTEVTYRCIDCRNCTECKKSQRLDSVSIREEVEQSIIDRCVKVDLEHRTTTAKLPFVVADPDTRLVPNMRMALKVYKAQIKKLEKAPEDKLAIIDSENKLQKLGFVDYISDLDQEDKKLILNSDTKYFIAWRAVWNEKSISTPCRLVFDASQSPPEGCSLNSLLAKGHNSMNKLVEILVRWTLCKHAFHTDIQKVYNAIRLDKSHWRYQVYLWENNLKSEMLPHWNVIKTLIYGVRSSGESSRTRHQTNS